MPLDYPELKAKTTKAEKLVVLLHGYGSDGHDLISLAPYFQYKFPGFHFFSPHGVEHFELAPFGYQWFSLMDRSPATLQKQLSNNAHTIIELIKYKQQELELDNSDTVIIGFSQGTMVGLYLTLIASEPFAALVGFSGRLIQPSSCVNKSTPICLLHGEDDDIVPVESIDEIADYLRVNQVQFEAHKLSNLTHSIDARGIELACNFLKSNLYIPT